MRRLLSVIALLPLAACGSDADPGPGGVTAGEARALDEAAEMVEKQRMPDEALRPSIMASATASPAAP